MRKLIKFLFILMITIVLSSFASAYSETLGNELVLAMPFNDSVDYSDNAFPFSEQGTITYGSTSCIHENCYQGSGSDADYLNTSSISLVSGVNWAVSVWLEFDASNVLNYVLDFDSVDIRSSIWRDNSNHVGTEYPTGKQTYATDEDISLANWIFQHNSSGTYIYKNGTLVQTGDAGTTLNEGILILFKDKVSANRFFKGEVDELYIWNRSLTMVEIADLSANNGSSFYPFTLDSTPLTLQKNTQIPSDIRYDTFNIVNITYNISHTSELNTSTINLYSKTNSTTSDTLIYTNGAFTGGYIKNDYISNISDTFKFVLADNDILPATYNIDEELMENTSHNTGLIYDNEFIKIQLINISLSKQYNYIEMMISGGGTQSARIYYCNDTYTTGNPDIVCTNFYNLQASTPYNHTHSIYSSHKLIPFPIIDGKINGVGVTSTSYIFVEGRGGLNAWTYSYLPISVRTGNSQVSTNNGVSYSTIAGTIDAHAHQFNGTEKIYYYADVCDINNLCANSSIYSETLEFDPLPPTSPDVYKPTTGGYGGVIEINYTASTPYPTRTIQKYNISLYDSTLVYVKDIRNNTLNLSYNWDSTGTPQGTYYIRVDVCDNASLCSFGYSSEFDIDTTNPSSLINAPDVYENATAVISYLFTDDNLYSYYINVTYPNGTTIINETNISLTGKTSVNAGLSIDMTGLPLGVYTANARVCDGHTLSYVDDMDVIKDTDELIFDDISISFLDKISAVDTSYIKLDDRYSFSLTTERAVTSKEIIVSSPYYIDILENTGYKGHLVTGNKWIDFEGELIDNVIVNRIDDKTVRVSISSTKPISIWEFNSIGELNCITDSETFEYMVAPIPPDNIYDDTDDIAYATGWFNNDALDYTTTAGMMGYFFIFIILVGLIVACETIKIPALAIITGLGVVFFGIYLYTIISSIIGILSILFGLFYMVGSSRFL